MRVRDIVRPSEWVPPKDGRRELAVTVLLPNYNRGQSGMLEAAIKSILTQSERDLELIIIDDGSTDNSLEISRRYLDSDQRVGLIYHPKNVGLPAVSAFEGFR